MITHERLLDVLNYECESGVFTWRKKLSTRGPVGKEAGYRSRRGRISIRIDGELYLAHRLAWFFVHSVWPEFEIDHINVNESDNRISNLRESTRSQNLFNTHARRTNKLGIKGVHYSSERGKWVAAIRANGKQKILGRFSSPYDAAAAYASASEMYHGSYGRVSWFQP